MGSSKGHGEEEGECSSDRRGGLRYAFFWVRATVRIHGLGLLSTGHMARSRWSSNFASRLTKFLLRLDSGFQRAGHCGISILSFELMSIGFGFDYEAGII